MNNYEAFSRMVSDLREDEFSADVYIQTHGLRQMRSRHACNTLIRVFNSSLSFIVEAREIGVFSTRMLQVSLSLELSDFEHAAMLTLVGPSCPVNCLESSLEGRSFAIPTHEPKINLFNPRLCIPESLGVVARHLLGWKPFDDALAKIAEKSPRCAKSLLTLKSGRDLIKSRLSEFSEESLADPVILQFAAQHGIFGLWQTGKMAAVAIKSNDENLLKVVAGAVRKRISKIKCPHSAAAERDATLLYALRHTPDEKLSRSHLKQFKAYLQGIEADKGILNEP